MNKKVSIFGAVLIVVGIVLGAFGAHALKEILSPEKLISFETGVRYQMYHGISLLIMGVSAEKFKFSLKSISSLLLLGVLFFSGSIYLLSIQELIGANLKFLGPITPVGGLLLIIGWCIFIFQIITKEKNSK